MQSQAWDLCFHAKTQFLPVLADEVCPQACSMSPSGKPKQVLQVTVTASRRVEHVLCTAQLLRIQIFLQSHGSYSLTIYTPWHMLHCYQVFDQPVNMCGKHSRQPPSSEEHVREYACASSGDYAAQTIHSDSCWLEAGLAGFHHIAKIRGASAVGQQILPAGSVHSAADDAT